MRRILLTGGAGFIGSHACEHIMENTDDELVILDRLTYAGNQNFLTDIERWEEFKKRVSFVYHDFRAPISPTTDALIGDITHVIHMGAETHVTRSLEDPMTFAESNVIGTINMLEFAKKRGIDKFIYCSTDEVYGPTNGNLHREGEPHRPSNPYSASKSGAEAFCRAYFTSYGLPVIITNTMNNFGERQNAEKFVPMVVKNILLGKTIPVHCKKIDGEVVEISSRCWLHARNHADGLFYILKNGLVGEQYNIVGDLLDVSAMVDLIASFVGKEPVKEFIDFHSFHPGHDMHYGLDGTKMKEMGWVPPVEFKKSLEKTVRWMKENPRWLEV
jgi:dTDP-glucose 4,6-dehydratase